MNFIFTFRHYVAVLVVVALASIASYHLGEADMAARDNKDLIYAIDIAEKQVNLKWLEMTKYGSQLPDQKVFDRFETKINPDLHPLIMRIEGRGESSDKPMTSKELWGIVYQR